MFVTRSVVRCQNEFASRLELNDAILDIADSDFRSLQVLKDSDRFVQGLSNRFNASNDLSMILMRAVGKVQTRNVHSGGHEFCDHFLRIRSRSDCANDLGSTRNHFRTLDRIRSASSAAALASVGLFIFSYAAERR